ncbi:NDR1/HIN1-like protein 26 [Actinidia eriantha]|uniref:NDR1/HIN1-like protein 26 n=1 Tax=Actinidia eriantha TaxID=165200 RepID=UPI00258BDB5C|nr:NDR1/HIN1-like protein 26 [Actinidia eriantha]
MSQVLTKSPKHCATKQGFNINKHHKKLFYAFCTFFLSILSFLFLVWLILHPSKPDFSLKEANIYQLNISTPHNLLNSSIQLTLLSKNPNNKVGIYYDKLQVYASYKGQEITADSSLPPFYQGHGERNMLSTELAGAGLPVGPTFGYEVGCDWTAGKMFLSLHVKGSLRWKVGTWVSSRYTFHVNCAAITEFGSNTTSGSMKSKQGIRCSTSV